VTDFFTVVAFYNRAINLIGLLGALGLHVTQLFTVGTLHNAAINWLTCILQTLEVLRRTWPTILFLGTSGLVGPTPCDSVLLVQVTLEVH